MALRLSVIALVMAAGVAVAQSVKAAQTDKDVQPAQVALLEAEVTAAEDVSAIKRLQRSYGYFLDKGLWTDLAEYFTDDAVANYPSGVYVGKESIRTHLYRNVGAVPMGQVGLAEGRLYNHMSFQPVIHLDASGQAASGRWRTIAMLGSYGGAATWADGLYLMRYRKEAGVWKISRLDYHSGFSGNYERGWVPPAAGPAAGPVARRDLPHPADIERNRSCDGFASNCIAPFHYANPGVMAGGRAWVVDPASISIADLDARSKLGQLAARATRLRDEQQIENLQRIYGYYYDRKLWDAMADLFDARGSIEFAQQGVYLGRERVRQFLKARGTSGLQPGVLNERLQLQIIVSVAADGQGASLRGRELAMTGEHGGAAEWAEGIYENRFVKQNGQWRFASLRYFPTFQTDYAQGWGKQARSADGPLPNLKPDRPPTERYEIYPRAHIPRFHYNNPVTGQPPTYPAAMQGMATSRTLASSGTARRGHLVKSQGLSFRASALSQAFASTQATFMQVRDHLEIENLQNAYGYYLDRNLWDSLADLFSRDASMELALRGVYRGDRIRPFLWQVFGRGEQGPTAGRLGNHVQLQPVITLNVDGRTANGRVRMLQQMSFGPRASLGLAVYENQYVKEDGVWKFSKLNAFNTLSAGYDGGWSKAAGRGMPGPSRDFPPDAPPSREVAMFPVVLPLPFHYSHPLTGQQIKENLPSLAEQLKMFPLPTVGSANGGAAAGQ